MSAMTFSDDMARIQRAVAPAHSAPCAPSVPWTD